MVLLLGEITVVWSLNHIPKKPIQPTRLNWKMVELGNVEITCKNKAFNLKMIIHT